VYHSEWVGHTNGKVINELTRRVAKTKGKAKIEVFAKDSTNHFTCARSKKSETRRRLSANRMPTKFAVSRLPPFSFRDFAFSGFYLSRFRSFEISLFRDFAFSGFYLSRFRSFEISLFRDFTFRDFALSRFCLSRFCLSRFSVRDFHFRNFHFRDYATYSTVPIDVHCLRGQWVRRSAQ
jgi:hypothetical protein